MLNDVKLGQPELELAKKTAHAVWGKYDDTHGYRSGKQNYNESVPTDHPDNIWFFWGQFDSSNQEEFAARVIKASEDPASEKLSKWVKIELHRGRAAAKDVKERFGFTV